MVDGIPGGQLSLQRNGTPSGFHTRFEGFEISWAAHPDFKFDTAKLLITSRSRL